MEGGREDGEEREGGKREGGKERKERWRGVREAMVGRGGRDGGGREGEKERKGGETREVELSEIGVGGDEFAHLGHSSRPNEVL